MSLETLMITPGPDIYYDESFRRVLEDHLSYLRSLASTRALVVSANLAWKYERDFYGLLQYLQIEPHLHWLVLRLNKLTSPIEFQIEEGQILVPEPTVLDRMVSSHMSTRRII